MAFEELIERVAKFIDDRDWRKFQTTKDLAASATVESGELLELFLWRDSRLMDVSLRSGEDPDLLKKVKNETADVLFTCLAIAEHLNFDLEKAFTSKMDELEERYSVKEVKGKVVKFPSKE